MNYPATFSCAGEMAGRSESSRVGVFRTIATVVMVFVADGSIPFFSRMSSTCRPNLICGVFTVLLEKKQEETGIQAATCASLRRNEPSDVGRPSGCWTIHGGAIAQIQISLATHRLAICITADLQALD